MIISKIKFNLESKRQLLLISIALSLFAALFFMQPIAQDLAYHHFSDANTLFSVPNFWNVVSNLPFLFIGIIGLALLAKGTPKGGMSELRMAYITFFIGLIITGTGSSYYHLDPNNASLVWDRLPMTISFMGLFIALLVENVPDFNEKPALPIAVLLGLSSVIYWHYLDDLRFYGFMQFTPLVAIPFILYAFKGRYTHRVYLSYGLLFYILAKVFELTDRLIFEQTGQLFSGHTIKHLLAAAATYCIYLMLKQRQPINRVSQEIPSN